MGTTYQQDAQHYNTVMTTYREAGTNQALSNVQLAGTHWARARQTHGSVVDKHVTDAFKEAGALLNAGYLKATAALMSGDEEAKLLMTKWFGRRHTGQGGMDTWKGAKRILGHLQTRLSLPIKLYYRGEPALVGLANDYPGGGPAIDNDDIGGYAESGAGDTDGVIGLCRLFFEKGGKSDFSMNRKGFDSIGGTIVHELSHNYCGTEDHDAVDGGTCYGTEDCLLLAKKRAIRAWYNADNLEYFCEECSYGIVASKVALATGSVSSVGNLRQAQSQLIQALQDSKARPTVVPVVRGPSQNVSSLMQAHLSMRAVANNPTLPVQTGAGNKVSELRKLWH